MLMGSPLLSSLSMAAKMSRAAASGPADQHSLQNEVPCWPPKGLRLGALTRKPARCSPMQTAGAGTDLPAMPGHQQVLEGLAAPSHHMDHWPWFCGFSQLSVGGSSYWCSHCSATAPHWLYRTEWPVQSPKSQIGIVWKDRKDDLGRSWSIHHSPLPSHTGCWCLHRHPGNRPHAVPSQRRPHTSGCWVGSMQTPHRPDVLPWRWDRRTDLEGVEETWVVDHDTICWAVPLPWCSHISEGWLGSLQNLIGLQTHEAFKPSTHVWGRLM